MRRPQHKRSHAARLPWATVRYWRETDAQAALAAHRASGLSLPEFARRHGLTVQRLRWWRQRLTPAPSAAPTPPHWLPVQLLPAPACAAPVPLEVVVRGGPVIRVPADFDPAVLRRVVEALATATRPC
jgi:hypothetical protein